MSWVFSLLSNSLRTGLFVTLCFGAVNQSPAQLTQDAYMTTGMTELDYSTISIVDTAKQGLCRELLYNRQSHGSGCIAGRFAPVPNIVIRQHGGGDRPDRTLP